MYLLLPFLKKNYFLRLRYTNFSESYTVPQIYYYGAFTYFLNLGSRSINAHIRSWHMNKMIILHANYNCRFLYALSVVSRESWAVLLQTNFDSLDKIEISLPIIYWTSSKWIGTLRTCSYKNESCLNHTDFKSTYNNIHGKKKTMSVLKSFGDQCSRGRILEG